MKKLRETKKEAVNQQKKLDAELQKQKELEAIVAEAQKEEEETLKKLESEITSIAEEHELFCGVILSHSDILNIVSLAMNTQENIKIPFRLYDKQTNL